MAKTVKRGSAKARLKSARLTAVQAVYQFFTTEKDDQTIVREFLADHLNQTIDGQDLITADAELLSIIVQGVYKEIPSLVDLVEASLTRQNFDMLDDILKSTLLCGAFELVHRPETDKGIILNDYMDVAKAFYEQKEAGLVNAVLDSVAKAVR